MTSSARRWRQLGSPPPSPTPSRPRDPRGAAWGTDPGNAPPMDPPALPQPRCWSQEVPAHMPWAGRAPVVVSFSAAALPRRPPPRPAALACKRRLEKQELEPTRKHFLSEDKMAARFDTLSLDHDHAYGSNGFPSRWPRPLPRGPQDATLEEEEETVILDGEFPMALTTEAVLWSPPGSQDPRGIWALLQAGALTPKATVL